MNQVTKILIRHRRWKEELKEGDNTTTFHVVQIWENKRNDYYAQSVDITFNLYATDGSVLKTKTQSTSLSRKGSTPVTYTINNDTGSKANKFEVTITSVDWQEVSKDNSKDQLEISGRPYIAEWVGGDSRTIFGY